MPFSSKVDIDQLKFIILTELESKLFLYVPIERAKYYNNSKTWSSIINKFPSLEDNLIEAGNCFALARYTACVVHLMRSLETPLKVFGREVGVSIDVLNMNSWGQILVKIENAVNNLKKDDQNKEYYSQLTSYFFILKNAWRNYTLHGNSKYTEEEADKIFNNCKAFIEKLAQRFKE